MDNKGSTYLKLYFLNKYHRLRITMNYRNSSEVVTPVRSIDRVIGHSEVIRQLVNLSARQRRHLLLVGIPGIGKSMIAKALSDLLPSPTEEVYVYENPENPERPLIHIERYDSSQLQELEGGFTPSWVNVSPDELPNVILDDLNYRCRHCGVLSNSDLVLCTNCGKVKSEVNVSNSSINTNKMIDLLFNNEQNLENHTPRYLQVTPESAREHNIRPGLYERARGVVRVYSELSSKVKINEMRSHSRRLLALNRKRFVHAIASTETELLGDNRHDPYGGDKNLGSMSYKKVILGAIHEAHQGVLFIDEVGTFQETQKDLLVAMQNKSFPITGKNSRSSGSSVRVDNVPCDFVLVLACNLVDLSKLSSPLRSRIQGYGYEVLLKSAMEETPEARESYYRFIAQEVENTGNIPHFTIGAMDKLIDIGRAIAQRDGFRNSLTLRLRYIGGLIRSAGDYAVLVEAEYVSEEHIVHMQEMLPDLETQITQTYGSLQRGLEQESTLISKDEYDYEEDYI